MKVIDVGDPNLNARMGIKVNDMISKFLFENVVDFDLSSLYPSIILAFNVDATTQIGKIIFNENSKFNGEDLADDLVTNDYINVGKKYYNLPNITDMLNIIDDLEAVA